MIKNVDIKTTIQDYKKNKENDGKIAIYHIAARHFYISLCIKENYSARELSR